MRCFSHVDSRCMLPSWDEMVEPGFIHFGVRTDCKLRGGELMSCLKKWDFRMRCYSYVDSRYTLPSWDELVEPELVYFESGLIASVGLWRSASLSWILGVKLFRPGCIWLAVSKRDSRMRSFGHVDSRCMLLSWDELVEPGFIHFGVRTECKRGAQAFCILRLVHVDPSGS